MRRSRARGRSGGDLAAELAARFLDVRAGREGATLLTFLAGLDADQARFLLQLQLHACLADPGRLELSLLVPGRGLALISGRLPGPNVFRALAPRLGARDWHAAA